MPTTSVYFTETSLRKIDQARGKAKRSTVLNAVLNHVDEDYLRSLIR